MSSERSSSNYDFQFSSKRYFINNLDSYNGEYILKEMSNVLEQNATESNKHSSQTMLGEGDVMSPSAPVQPYEIIGKTVISITYYNICLVLVIAHY